MLTENGFVAPERGDLGAYQRQDRKVDEPHEETSTKMQVKAMFL